MFATGGGDAVVTVWDTNAMARACSFDVEDAVYDVQFHPWAASHALLASAQRHNAPGSRASARSEPSGPLKPRALLARTGAGGSTVVRMCDLRSGSSVHMLSGHRARVTCLAWSPACVFRLPCMRARAHMPAPLAGMSMSSPRATATAAFACGTCANPAAPPAWRC